MSVPVSRSHEDGVEGAGAGAFPPARQGAPSRRRRRVVEVQASQRRVQAVDRNDRNGLRRENVEAKQGTELSSAE